MNGFPDKLNVMGVVYPIQYVDKVIRLKGKTNNAKVNFDRRFIKIFAGNKSVVREVSDIIQSLLHETFHIFCAQDHVIRDSIKPGYEEEFVTQLAMIMTDTLMRNHFQEWGNEKKGKGRK